MVQRLQCLAQHVICGCLHLLNARNIVTANNDWMVCQSTAIDLPTIVTKKRHSKQTAFARPFECHHDVARAAAGRDADRYILRLRLREELAQKNDLYSYIVGERSNVGRFHGEGD